MTYCTTLQPDKPALAFDQAYDFSFATRCSWPMRLEPIVFLILGLGVSD